MSLAEVGEMMVESCARGFRQIWSGKLVDKRYAACKKNWYFCMLLWRAIYVPLNGRDLCCDLVSFVCLCIVVSLPQLFTFITFFLSFLPACSMVVFLLYLLIVDCLKHSRT